MYIYIDVYLSEPILVTCNSISTTTKFAIIPSLPYDVILGLKDTLYFYPSLRSIFKLPQNFMLPTTSTTTAALTATPTIPIDDADQELLTQGLKLLDQLGPTALRHKVVSTPSVFVWGVV